MTVPSDLSARAATLLPNLDTDGRLDLLGAMTPEEASNCMAWLAAVFPDVFDALVVRDRTLPGRLKDRIREKRSEDEDGGGSGG